MLTTCTPRPCTASKQVFLKGAWREEVPVEVFGKSLGSFLWRRGRRGGRSTGALGASRISQQEAGRSGQRRRHGGAKRRREDSK